MSLVETLNRDRTVAEGHARRPKPLMLAAAGAGVTVVGALTAGLIHPLVGLALAAAIVATPFVLRDITVAFVAMIAVITLLPFGAVPLGIGFNPTYLDGALLAVYAIWTVRLATRTDSLTPLPPLWQWVLIVAGIMVAALLAGVSHTVPTRNQIRVFGELLLGVGLFFVVGTLISDRRTLGRVFLALAGLAFAAACLGLGLYVLPDALEMRLLSLLSVADYPTGPGVLRYLNDDPSRLQRATGTSVDPNSFGGMLAVTTALLAPQIISRRPLINRRLAAAMTAVMAVALLATVSRGSLAGFAVAILVIGLVRDRRLIALGVAAAIGLLAATGFLPWTERYVAHLTAGLMGQDLATQMRFGEYRDAIRLIERYPVLGVGFGGVRDIDLYRGVSSLYLIIAETMGLLGLGAFVAALAAFSGRLAASWRRLPADGLRAVVLGCLAALTAAAVSGVFDHYFFTYPHAFALLWLIIAIGMCALRVAAQEDEGHKLKGPGLPRA